jgi:glycine cleavage system H protein
MSVPSDLRYTPDHEWLREEGALAVVGITQHAQEALGDIVFVDLPAVGTQVKAGATFGTVESVKAVSDLFAPISGEVAAVNEAVTGKPEMVNQDPYGAAWMIKIKPSDKGEIGKLLSPADYEKLLAG